MQITMSTSREHPDTLARTIRFCRSGLVAAAAELFGEADEGRSGDLDAANRLLDLGIGQMCTPSGLNSRRFQVQPRGLRVGRARADRLVTRSETLRFTVDLAPGYGPDSWDEDLAVTWFNLATLEGGSHPLDQFAVENLPDPAARSTLVHAGHGVVVAAIDGSDAEEGAARRPGFVLLGE
ncbi:hypothetical protein [Rhodococcus sp. NPDC058514]|uniref:hypothetical protein n=1 Tax=unclassified Rhodococcus (in: high G+C Gram-positive bacteria) TaxID=192944 RepID=UPI003650D039